HQADQIRNAVERALPGQVVFVDNLVDSLNSAAGDALYAETLYIMLAVPGALVALALAYLAALGTAERDRRDLALLRARGASRRGILVMAAVESLVLGLLAGALGTGRAPCRPARQFRRGDRHYPRARRLRHLRRARLRRCCCGAGCRLIERLSRERKRGAAQRPPARSAAVAAA